MSNFYCAAPWRGLHINPLGNIKTCCAGQPNLLGNLNNQTISEVLNGPVLKEIRTNISQGIPHEYCSNCVKAERFGADSERQWHNNVNPNFDYSTAGSEYHWPTIVDVRWNTTCNLSCNYCGPDASSKWSGLKGIPIKSGTRPYYEDVCDFIAQYREHTKEVALVGGEPLLLPENERLLDVIPSDCIVTVISNMSVDFKNNKVFKKLQQRNKVGWSMSFDNIGERFEYVRYGGKWDLLQHNLEIIKNLRKQGQWGGIHAVYNIYNATRLCEFKQFAIDNELSIVWQNLFWPSYLDPFNHGQDVAELAAAEITQLINNFSLTNSETEFFQQALTKYQNITDSGIDTKKQFMQHTADIENKYHPDQQGQFEQLWPELAEIYKRL
jgi:hypothetical protein